MSAHAAAPLPTNDPLEPRPFIEGAHTDQTLNDALLQHVWRGAGKGWWACFMVALSMLGLFVVAVTVTLAKGIGSWGNNIPVGWAFDIINFVWWIGIGHAGTLISAILLLFQQKWRTSINRFAEAMTLFAVMCALVFPLLHTGRPWFAAYWLLPYPSIQGIWPQFKSALVWDVFAVSTYGTISLLFWYLGLIPDLAALRDSSPTKAKRLVYGIFAMGWRGSGRHWAEYKWAYLILAGLSTPLVLSVHTVVSFDFATSVLPGWHTTIFPPYFVAGAIFSGFAMVVSWMVPARHFLGLKQVVTLRHLDNMCKVMLATGMMVSYGYLMEHFVAWYSGNQYEFDVFFRVRQRGPFSYIYWLMVFCNVVVPQIFWFRKARTSEVIMWFAALLINVGMWCERFVIIVTSLHRDFLPASWGDYAPTWVDICLFTGTIGLFSTFFLLFLKFVPAVAITEVKELRHELAHDAHATHAGQAGGGTPMSHGDAFVPRRFVVAEFADSDALLAGTKRLRERGLRNLDTHTPYPIHGLEEALGIKRVKIPTIVLLAALTGAALGYSMMYFMNAVDFPINVANRPPHSAPAFIPITFELTILLGGTSAFFGLMALMKLPQPYHPIFEVESFRRASIDAFFLSVEVPAGDDAGEIGNAAVAAGATEVQIVEEPER